MSSAEWRPFYLGLSVLRNTNQHFGEIGALELETGIYHRYSLQICALHYDDVIMTTMASQITSLTIIYSTVYSGADQRKHQSSASLAFVRGIHRGPVNSPHKWPVTRKMFPFDDVIMVSLATRFANTRSGAENRLSVDCPYKWPWIRPKRIVNLINSFTIPLSRTTNRLVIGCLWEWHNGSQTLFWPKVIPPKVCTYY